MLCQGQMLVQLLPLLLLLLTVVPYLVKGHALVRQEEEPFGEVCYDQIGCFKNEGHFFDWTNRPVFLLPQSPSAIGTRFELYTRSNKNSHDLVDYNRPESLRNSRFDGRKPTKFLIHGYMSNPETNWILKMKDALLAQQDVNVFAVDWSRANGPIYSQATANIRVVGAMTAVMIEWLERQASASRTNMHILGHSLGAHAAGHAGERLGGRLGRITGMDPAGPYFENTNPVVRLDPTDARFVDAIHTDAVSIFRGGFGLYQPLGHLDFYPNGGKEQPGCTKNPIVSIIEGDRQFSITCNHVRVSHLIAATISNAAGDYTAVECGSYEDFKSGKCTCATKTCVRLGLTADQWRQDGRQYVKLYVDTSATEPYELSRSGDPNENQIDTSNIESTVAREEHVYSESDQTGKRMAIVDKANPLWREL